MAAESGVTGVYDICTGVQTTMNEVAGYFDCPIDYIPEAKGDHKDLSAKQDPKLAFEAFGYKYEIPFDYNSIKVYL